MAGLVAFSQRCDGSQRVTRRDKRFTAKLGDCGETGCSQFRRGFPPPANYDHRHSKSVGQGEILGVETYR